MIKVIRSSSVDCSQNRVIAQFATRAEAVQYIAANTVDGVNVSKERDCDYLRIEGDEDEHKNNLTPDPAHDVTGNGEWSHYDLARQLEMRGYRVDGDEVSTGLSCVLRSRPGSAAS